MLRLCFWDISGHDQRPLICIDFVCRQKALDKKTRCPKSIIDNKRCNNNNKKKLQCPDDKIKMVRSAVKYYELYFLSCFHFVLVLFVFVRNFSWSSQYRN